MSWSRKRKLRHFNTETLHLMLQLMRSRAAEYATAYGKDAGNYLLEKAVEFEVSAQDIAEVLSERPPNEAPQAPKAVSP